MIWGILVLVVGTALVSITITLGTIMGWLMAENLAKLIAYLREEPNEQDDDKQ